ncbi:SigE family RNA polymerase sigma factor [Streptomyces sp. NPDC003388]|uniref:SigE family RNA polymerase sigma factor n=1 Tax=unclassified Streptomyces TaxID=2593676 RepID=UPI001172F860|nr:MULTISPECIES: SigE family RNA polymerase sigma factor [unclassified Streptomyces]MDI1459130.1 SigE family RNA polymerase sigma factor [Streptomyces sp. ATE26]GEJ99411.1 RNA polymerase sigma24 factor [Streptomyces sp. 1-11]
MREAPADYLEFAIARSGPLFRTACLLTGDWHLAEDLVQETLAKMYRSWRRVSRAGSPVAYADTVLVRTFLSQRRLRSSTERPSDRLPDAAGPARDAELRMALLDGLARMTARDRAVLVLRYWEDRSVDDTAQVLRMSPGAVRAQSKRALQRLRTLLGGQLADLAA